MSSAPRTLYEDWQYRQEALRAGNCPPDQYRVEQLRILEFLLKRYDNTPQASQLARFPAQCELFLNRRAIVVHQHLGRGKVAGVKSEDESRRRISRVLGRMAQSPDAEAQDTAHAAWDEGSLKRDVEQDQALVARWQALADELCSRIRWRAAPSALFAAMEQTLGVLPYLPGPAVAYLFNSLEDEREPERAAELLVRCYNKSALDYGVLAWRRYLTTHGPDHAVVQTLASAFTRPRWPEATVEHFRGLLACDEAIVRHRAARVLRSIGTLDDVGLLLDILALPDTEFDGAWERLALLEVAQELSGQLSPETGT